MQWKSGELYVSGARFILEYIWVTLTPERLVSTKRAFILKQICSFQLQVYFSMYDLFVDTGG